MPTATRLAFGAALAMFAAGCANAVMVQPTTIGAYRPSMLNYAAGQGAMKTEIIGNPFDGPKEDLERVVTGGLTRSHFGPSLAFATSVSPDNRSPYRTVLVFNPTLDHTSANICGAPGRATQARGDRVRVLAAFCSADRAVTCTRGSVAGATGPTDAPFRALIRQLGLELFPLEDPTRGDDDRDSEFF